MIIGIDASRANRSHKSGTEWYSYYLIRWLAKLDSKNQYILYTDTPLTGGLLDLTTEQYLGDQKAGEIKYDEKGYQIIQSPYKNFKVKVLTWSFKNFWTQGRLSWEMLVNPPDVLFIPAHAIPLIHPKKTIVTIHDIGFQNEDCLYTCEPMGPENRKSRKFLNILVSLFTFGKYQANSLDYLRWSTEYGLKKAHKVITISQYTKNDLIAVYRAKADKIKVIYNGYNRFLYKKINDQDKIALVLNKYGITRPYFFYIGRLEKKKNIPALVEAFAIMRESLPNSRHKLLLVGDASAGYDEINYIINEFDLSGKVMMPGWIDEIDVPYIYNGADAFVFPSNYEGFGIPLLQAMACEVPVVASGVTSIPEVAKDAALLFNPKFVTSIAEALCEISTRPDLKEELIKKGRERVKEFSWEKCAQETLKEITYSNS